MTPKSSCATRWRCSATAWSPIWSVCRPAEHQCTIPGTLCTRVAAETLRDWLLHYRRGGFDALYPKPRGDRGQPRRLSWGAASIDGGSPSASVTGSSSMPSRYV